MGDVNIPFYCRMTAGSREVTGLAAWLVAAMSWTMAVIGGQSAGTDRSMGRTARPLCPL